MLEQVKLALGITGNFLDATIQIYIDEVVGYLLNAGVAESVIDQSVGIVVKGVSDLWNNGSGNSKLSPYFMQRATQLALSTKAEEARINELQTELNG